MHYWIAWLCQAPERHAQINDTAAVVVTCQLTQSPIPVNYDKISMKIKYTNLTS